MFMTRTAHSEALIVRGMGCNVDVLAPRLEVYTEAAMVPHWIRGDESAVLLEPVYPGGAELGAGQNGAARTLLQLFAHR